MSELKDTVVSAVAATAVLTLEEKRTALVAKIQEKLAESGISTKNKILYTLYLALVNSAGDALIEKLSAKIG